MVEDELVRVCNATDGAENVPRLQRSLPPNENSCIEKANSLTAVRTARCSTDESARSALPPVSQLDMSIIKHLPTVIISEMNDAYNGMLYDFIGKQCKDAKSETRCSSLSEKHTYDEGQSFSAVHGKMQLCFDTSASDAQTKNEVELATGTSNATSVLRNFSDAHDLNKSTLMTGVLDYSANVADETSWISKHMESETSEHSKVFLWSGSPPKWVEKFESLVPLYPIIWGSSNEDPIDAVNELSNLLFQYVDLKIDSDIEELYICFRLLERLTWMSNAFSQVYNMVLPSLQVSVSEKYGGTLQLGGSVY
ncbi:hypothetical protein HPP92_016411 [Vanilla planifolia]|uniref:Uncharacterized protein n=1 Tax=Vanilla planifolia TaxID=51239 RepID=A0A835UTB7_VANPL|nr:hypothetical protein HPP92_016411 [Vanilla planifolia]